MKYDAIWQAFARTGDPVYYLLYKGLNGRAEGDGMENWAGEEARPGD